MGDEQATDRLPALYAQMERIGEDAAHWADVEASSSSALVHVGSADPEKVREQMIEVRREARRKSDDLRRAADAVKAEVESILRAQRAEMEQRMNAAMEALAPLREQVKRMEEGIWTVNLYLGTSEQIVTLTKGAPAAPDTPITLRVATLAMDEEMAAFPVINGREDMQGLDYRSLDLFDEWIAQPEALRQVLPEERGIVVLRPRRTEYHYDDNPLVNDAANEPNRVSHWLIRNGENLYRMTTNFRVGDTLMPTSAEFTRLFQQRTYNFVTREDDVREILPGTEAWEKAEKAQGAIQRHYMRVALILQGLIDRTEVFEPLPGQINVMQQSAYDDGLVIVVNDAERQITTNREPYYDWIRRINADLRPGMRIIGTFHGGEWREDDDHHGMNYGNRRLSPATAQRPPSDVLHTIEARRAFRGEKGLVIRYQRTEQVYDERLWVPSETRPGWGHYGGYKTPTRRASAILLPSDISIIPFDLVTEEEMQQYLDARTERRAYADSFPLLNAAIAAKRAERKAEAPFRDLLARVLADDNGQTVDEVRPHVDALVHRFKVGNRWHRPLVSLSQEDEAKALRLIRAEYARIVRSGADDDRDANAVRRFREHDPEVMFVGRLSGGAYVAFAPQPRRYRPEVANPHLWVREYRTTKTAKTIKTREWVAPGVRGSKMTSLFEGEQWADWDRLHDAKDDLTDPEVDDILERVRSRAQTVLSKHGDTLLAITRDPNKAARWIAYGTDRSRSTGGFYRNSNAHVTRLSWQWRRQADGHSVSLTSVDDRGPATESVEMTYAGNRALDRDYKRAHERGILWPWRTRTRVGTFMYEDGGIDGHVLFEADAQVMADAEAWVRQVKAEQDESYDLDREVWGALEVLNAAQRAEAEEAIKAEFLAEYPDEDMWQEHRAAKTKHVRPGIDLLDNDRHFMRREPMGEDAWSLHERTDGAISLRAALRALHEVGQYQWGGLTVEGVYSLLDRSLPDTYEPIKHLVLPERGEGAWSGRR